MWRLATLLPLLLAGCVFGDGRETIDDAQVDELVLQPADVGPGFRATWIRAGARPASDVRYLRVRVDGGTGAREIASAVRVFASVEAAEGAHELAQGELNGSPAWSPIGEPGLGSESFAATLVVGNTRRYEVRWRQANATASLRAEAAEGALSLADVLGLARRQEQRLERATEER